MRQDFDVDGVVDIHAHCGPSPLPRRVDGYELAVEAAEVGMDGVVLKEHYLPTIYGVPYIDRLLADDGIDIEVFGSVVLNYCNGGFNPFMVQSAIDYGAQVIWAPTIDAKHDGDKSGGLGKKLGVDSGQTTEYEGKDGLTALDDQDELKDEVKLCVDKMAQADIVFSIGHLSPAETLALVEYGESIGYDRIVIDHPNFHITDLSINQQQELVNHGATINLPFGALSPRFRWASIEEIADNIRAVGIENCVISSDMGQTGNPSSPDGLRIYGEMLLMEGFTEDEVRTLAKRNPKRLLGLM